MSSVRYKRLVIDRRRAEATMNEFGKSGWRVVSYSENDTNHTATILLERVSDD